MLAEGFGRGGWWAVGPSACFAGTGPSETQVNSRYSSTTIGLSLREHCGVAALHLLRREVFQMTAQQPLVAERIADGR
jgi:hypothetical protein